MQHLRPTYNGELYWTRAHPERRYTDYNMWTRDERLNNCADAIAGGTHSEYMDNLPEPIIIEIPAGTVLKALTHTHQWQLREAATGHITLGGIKDRLQEHRLRNYLATRDQYRAEAVPPRPPK